jgi:DNA-binding response OmpR family regulator
MRLALITNDKVLKTNLVEFLAKDSIVVDPYLSDPASLRAIRATKYDLVLVDAKGGEPLANAMLAWHRFNADSCTRMIVLTTFSSWDSLLEWINAGADDVVNRQDQEQIRLRVLILLHREANRADTDHIELHGYQLRCGVHLVTLDNEEIALTAREFAMAWLFFSHPGQFVSRAQIACSVWGASEDVATRTIEQHVYRLRKKLRLSCSSALRLKTLYSLGYKLEIVLPTQTHTDTDTDSVADPRDVESQVNRPDEMLVP